MNRQGLALIATAVSVGTLGGITGYNLQPAGTSATTDTEGKTMIVYGMEKATPEPVVEPIAEPVEANPDHWLTDGLEFMVWRNEGSATLGGEEVTGVGFDSRVGHVMFRELNAAGEGRDSWNLIRKEMDAGSPTGNYVNVNGTQEQLTDYLATPFRKVK